MNKRKKRTLLHFTILWVVCLTLFSSIFSTLSAETSAEEVIQNSLRSNDSDKSKLIVLPFGATGMTESAAKAFSNMIAQNLSNTNRFEVLPIDAIEKEVQNRSPMLLPCFDIGCGIQMGKIGEADWILSGHISLTSKGMFSLNVKLVFIFDNSLAFEETIRFTDETMDRNFYQLSNRIADNAPVIGSILEANNKIAVIDLGERDGITVGDQLIIYKNLTVTSESGGHFETSVRRRNIGIIKITKSGKHVSEGVYFQSIEIPEPRQFVTTYLDKRKQIKLVNDIRKELDTHLRNVFEIKKSIVLSPVKLEDMTKSRWLRKVRVLENNRDLWRMILIGSGAATLFFFSQFEKGDDIKLLSALGAFGYSAFEFFSIRSQLRDLIDEGRYKGYLELKIKPDFDDVRLEYGFTF